MARARSPPTPRASIAAGRAPRRSPAPPPSPPPPPPPPGSPFPAGGGVGRAAFRGPPRPPPPAPPPRGSPFRGLVGGVPGTGRLRRDVRSSPLGAGAFPAKTGGRPPPPLRSWTLPFGSRRYRLRLCL